MKLLAEIVYLYEEDPYEQERLCVQVKDALLNASFDRLKLELPVEVLLSMNTQNQIAEFRSAGELMSDMFVYWGVDENDKDIRARWIDAQMVRIKAQRGKNA